MEVARTARHARLARGRATRGTALGVVQQPLGGEERLLASGKPEFVAAVAAGQGAILVHVRRSSKPPVEWGDDTRGVNRRPSVSCGGFGRSVPGCTGELGGTAGNHASRVGVITAMTASLRPLRGTLLLPALLIVAACAGSASPPGSGAPTGSPDPSPTGGASEPPPGTIAHPTGATDVILRFEEGGGFVPFGFLLTQAPEFTLYGDGTVVARNLQQDPLPDVGGVSVIHPFRTVKLAEPDVQALLAFALRDGGLGLAKLRYEHNQVADAPSAIFTINVEGGQKVVDVYALGMEGAPPADLDARRAFVALAERLRELAADATFANELYVPHAYRGVLTEGFPGNVERPWPWPGIDPDTFGPKDPSGNVIFQRVLTPEEFAAVGVAGAEGGLLNAMLRAADGTLYSLSVRPLLPDETS